MMVLADLPALVAVADGVIVVGFILGLAVVLSLGYAVLGHYVMEHMTAPVGQD